MNLNAVVDLEIKGFSGATVTRKEAGIFNGVVDASQAEPVVTQRPSIITFVDADSAGVGDRGRGIYYWDANTNIYFINNDTVYKNTYSNTVDTISAGTQKLHIIEGYDDATSLNVLIIIDAENSKAHILTTSDSLAIINDAQFHPNAGGTADQQLLANGGVILNGHLYIMNKAGDIANADLDNPSSWSSGNTINAEREEDKGVYLGKHHNDIVAFGTRTIEFFEDNANAVASPLLRREDISYNMGCAEGLSVWEDGDSIFFIGADPSGNLGVYLLKNYRPEKISKSGFDSLLTQALTKEGYTAVGSGLSAHGHTFYILSLYKTPTDISVEKTYVFDLTSGLWHEWETTLNGLTEFPLMDWTIRTGDTPRFGEGIMANGDLFSIQDDLIPTDTLEASIYVNTGYVEPDYVVEDAESTAAIQMIIRLGQFDGGTNKIKFESHLRPKMDATSASQDLILRWADNNESSFTSGETIDISDQYSSVLNAGSFRRRNHELETSSTEQVWIEALEADIVEGTQ